MVLLSVSLRPVQHLYLPGPAAAVSASLTLVICSRYLLDLSKTIGYISTTNCI